MKRIGVLALQGGVAEHADMLKRIPDVEPVLVKTAEELEATDALIIPGGESTAVGTILTHDSRGQALRDLLVSRIRQGFPVWGTCMGAILLARNICNDHRRHLAVMDIEVHRNAYGSQLDSFTVSEPILGLDGGPFPMVFIRAPVISEVGPGVQVLARHKGQIVACRQDNLLASTFHPELTEDDRFHRYFVSFLQIK
ncbi:pyridoxal 5'-phosphate synthase glutaminase subunit PdxT [Gracilinema caldarium]|uniref:pyridoxal 5'-phosphate synthase glutaminase subunit PdxT n=1 Tax=Gracilinema caldarium TaxID=215591 RepID=UPI0026F2B8DB|nr:pyridoxal 5'-phosphate synthase glutaminase subunit PdxT [Gracilinema caldarium]